AAFLRHSRRADACFTAPFLTSATDYPSGAFIRAACRETSCLVCVRRRGRRTFLPADSGNPGGGRRQSRRQLSLGLAGRPVLPLAGGWPGGLRRCAEAAGAASSVSRRARPLAPGRGRQGGPQQAKEKQNEQIPSLAEGT